VAAIWLASVIDTRLSLDRRSRCLSLNLPISKSVVRLNATFQALPQLRDKKNPRA
jgi:hypothetical protein